MDKFNQRCARARSLCKKRYLSLAAFSLLSLAFLLFSCFSRFRACFVLFFALFFVGFFYLLDKLQKELFLRQLRDALLSMEDSVRVGRVVLYPLPISCESGSSYLWESIRARVLYRYRYHARSFDYNFAISNSSDPIQCAWSAAWFFASDDLKHAPSEDLLRFSIQLAEYGSQNDYFSDISFDDWRDSLRYRYTDPVLKSIVNDFLRKAKPPQP